MKGDSLSIKLVQKSTGSCETFYRGSSSRSWRRSNSSLARTTGYGHRSREMRLSSLKTKHRDKKLILQTE